VDFVDDVVEIAWCRLNFLDGWYCPVINFSAATSTLYPDWRKHVDRSLSVKPKSSETNTRNIWSFSWNDDEFVPPPLLLLLLLLSRFAMIILFVF
jgi:hypothetical protein